MKNKPVGFRFTTNKNNEITIFHQGRTATSLRGSKASAFLNFAANATDEELQHRMARLTGNYKRGNERGPT
ncbi:MAG: hypothetical protein O3C68_07590 [Proteobacteria bacterium]|nr:hypothetical protein [Pseudomonadota bacterium]